MGSAISGPNRPPGPQDGSPHTINQSYTADHCATNSQTVTMNITIIATMLGQKEQEEPPYKEEATEQAQAETHAQPTQASTEVDSPRHEGSQEGQLIQPWRIQSREEIVKCRKDAAKARCRKEKTRPHEKEGKLREEAIRLREEYRSGM